MNGLQPSSTHCRNQSSRLDVQLLWPRETRIGPGLKRHVLVPVLRIAQVSNSRNQSLWVTVAAVGECAVGGSDMPWPVAVLSESARLLEACDCTWPAYGMRAFAVLTLSCRTDAGGGARQYLRVVGYRQSRFLSAHLWQFGICLSHVLFALAHPRQAFLSLSGRDDIIVWWTMREIRRKTSGDVGYGGSLMGVDGSGERG